MKLFQKIKGLFKSEKRKEIEALLAAEADEEEQLLKLSNAKTADCSAHGYVPPERAADDDPDK